MDNTNFFLGTLLFNTKAVTATSLNLGVKITINLVELRTREME
jgi:hypothetical protein